MITMSWMHTDIHQPQLWTSLKFEVILHVLPNAGNQVNAAVPKAFEQLFVNIT